MWMKVKRDELEMRPFGSLQGLSLWTWLWGWQISPGGTRHISTNMEESLTQTAEGAVSEHMKDLVGMFSTAQTETLCPNLFPLLYATCGHCRVPGQVLINHPSQDQHPKEGSVSGHERDLNYDWSNIYVGSSPHSSVVRGKMKVTSVLWTYRETLEMGPHKNPTMAWTLIVLFSSFSIQVPGSSESGNLIPWKRGRTAFSFVSCCRIGPHTYPACVFFSFLHLGFWTQPGLTQEVLVSILGEPGQDFVSSFPYICWSWP